MIYSVWNQGRGVYDYYQTPGNQETANAPKPKHLRSSGPEPLDPGEGGTLEGIPIWDGLSDNEKKLAVVAAASAAAWFLFGKKVMRKNPTKRSKSKSKKMYVLVWDGESFGEVSGAFAVSRSKKTIDQAVEYWRDYGVPTKVVRK